MKLSKNIHRLAIVIWILIALAYLTFFLADLRLDFAQLQAPCTGANCNYLSISQAEIDVLESWGLSSLTYSIVITGAIVIGVAASWVLGSLILWRQGNTRIGWAVSLVLIIIPITMISDANNLAATYPGLFIPSVVLSEIGNFVWLLFFYLFPNGRFYPRWAYTLFLTTFLTFVAFSIGYTGLIPLSPIAFNVAYFLVIGLLATAGAFQIMRYRKDSTMLERQQTKWILLGIIFLMLCFPVWFLFFGNGLEIPPGQPRLLASMGGWLACMLFITAFPISMAISIQRYQLWDMDLVIRRTLQYALLTGLLVMAYFGGIVILQWILNSLTGSVSSPLVTVITTLGIAALFNPLRIRVQDFIDRRFFRNKYDAEQALAQFAAVARDEVEMDKLTTALLGVVEETMQPERVSLWLNR